MNKFFTIFYTTCVFLLFFTLSFQANITEAATSATKKVLITSPRAGQIYSLTDYINFDWQRSNKNSGTQKWIGWINLYFVQVSTGNEFQFGGSQTDASLAGGFSTRFNDHSYSSHISDGIYKVIAKDSDGNIVAQSGLFVVIKSPSITPDIGSFHSILFPNGSETLEAARTHQIMWMAENFSEKRVKIELGTLPKNAALGTQPVYTRIATPKNTGTYSWKVPKKLGTKYKENSYMIKISAPKTSDQSDQPFFIMEKYRGN